MYRKDFIKNSLVLGLVVSANPKLSGAIISAKDANEAKLIINGLKAFDAHSHPYHFHTEFFTGRLKNLRTTSTVSRMEEGGFVASAFAAVGDRLSSINPQESLFNDTLAQIERVRAYEQKEILRIIRINDDLNFPHPTNNLFGALIAVEGGDALEGNLSNIKRLYEKDVRLITLMHKTNNQIGYHQESSEDGPLKTFGIKVVERMNELGIIVDVAHSNTKTLESIAEVTQIPLIDSHTAPFPENEKNNFPNRARSWKEMELIVKTGGIVCTMPIGYKLGSYSRTTISDWAKEIVLMKERLGIEHIGIGTDSGGLPQLVDSWQNVSSFSILVKELLKVGLTENEIKSFAGDNFLRLAKSIIN